MKAIIIEEFGLPSVLKLTEVPIPDIAENEVLVKVNSISINPVDVKTRAGAGVAGRLKNQMPIILGWDVSGTVVASDAPGFKTGDEVFGMVNFPGHGKAYAALISAPANQLALKPANITHEEAAAATLAALTAWQSFVHHAKIHPGQRVLIHAGSGGVGHYAVQIAKHLGAYVIATSSAANRDFVMSLGADEHIDYKAKPFEEAVSNIDFVFDTVGGELINRSLDVIKPGGRLISIPTSISPENQQKAKDLNITCSFELVQSNGADMEQIADLLSKGILKSHLFKIYDFEDMASAHEQQESGRTVGKIVVNI
jgi:NADPH:quinone reductase-like Zn-dependent oxidoreductase